MLRLSLKYGADKRTSPLIQHSVSRNLAPVRPCVQATTTTRQLSVVLARSEDQHGSNSANRQLQIRQLHTSNSLHARLSFGKRIQDKINKFRQDPAASNKLMGVGAAGYTVAKVSKLGAVAKFAFPILKLTKAMPLMSMGLTTVCYSCFFGVPFAVGIVGAITASNAARTGALKYFGCEVQPQMMIPFFGTMSSGSDSGDYKKSEEYVLSQEPFKRCLVTLAPVAGMFVFTAAAPLGMGGILMGSQCGYAVANTGFMMGMFSLLPMGDMTPGGQLLNFFTKKALLMGTVFNLALCTVLSNPILYLCFFLNLYRLYKRGFTLFGRQFGGDDEADVNNTIHALTTQQFTDQQKIIIASMYWGLFVLNAAGLTFVSQSLKTPQMLREQYQAEERERQSNAPVLQNDDGSFSRPDFDSSSGGGFGIGDWAMGNLNMVEEMERDEGGGDPLDWWEEAQRQAEQSVPANERFSR